MPKSKAPLSPKMQEVVDTMRSGSGYWEAICSHDLCFIQEGKIGHGGQHRKLAVHTFSALHRRGVLVRAAGSTKYETHYTLAPEYSKGGSV